MMNIMKIMTREDKDLLLKDICARLPYGVKVESTFINPDTKEHKPYGTTVFDAVSLLMIRDGLGAFKPYLFPLSSMTEEQKYDFYCRFIESDYGFDDFKEFYLDNGMWHKLLTTLDDIEAIIDWFHKNHIDYRGLIPMGLANDATGLNIY
jgi:hypothetical protein